MILLLVLTWVLGILMLILLGPLLGIEPRVTAIVLQTYTLAVLALLLLRLAARRDLSGVV